MTVASSNTLVFHPAHALQAKLTARETTSVELIGQYLDQIGRHNHEGLGLHAVLSLRPREQLDDEAQTLDAERAEGCTRGPLHGIPILVKDAVVTDEALGIPTTAGSAVFAHMKAKRNATVIEKLRQAGMIILGKTNMTVRSAERGDDKTQANQAQEFCGLKSINTPIGWSAYGGQTLSPYRREGLLDKDQPIPGGSSSGSAVGIAAGFAPVALGTETCGSIVYPASLNGLYGIKMTPSLTPLDGLFRLSETFDGIGPMGRDPFDLASVVEVLLTEQGRAGIVEGGYAAAMAKGFAGLSIGVVDCKWGVDKSMVEGKWDRGAVVDQWEATVETLTRNGCRVVYPLQVEDAGTALDYGGETNTTVTYYEFPSMVGEFIANFHPNPEITCLADIVAWNETHAAEALPPPYTTQTELRLSLQSRMTREKRGRCVEVLRRLAGPDGMDRVMKEQDIEVVLAPSDSTLISYAGCAGWPIAALPVGNWDKNGQPFGVFALARQGREDVLLRLMAAWHGVFAGAEPPRIAQDYSIQATTATQDS